MENAGREFGKTLDQDADSLKLTYALKEWAASIAALSAGELVLLLRKGGLKDPARPFACPSRWSALFPTYEHQSPGYFKSPGLMDRVADEPSLIVIQAWVEITHTFSLRSPLQIEALMPFHIWTKDFMAERLKWRPDDPIQVLVVRTYQLPQPYCLERSPLYGGCRSWIALENPLEVSRKFPAISDREYELKLKAIEAALQTINPFNLDNVQFQTE